MVLSLYGTFAKLTLETLTGPAGGVVGYARTSPSNMAQVGFDMGGLLLLGESYM